MLAKRTLLKTSNPDLARYFRARALEQLRILGVIKKNDANLNYMLRDDYYDWLQQWRKISWSLWTGKLVVEQYSNIPKKKQQNMTLPPENTLPSTTSSVFTVTGHSELPKSPMSAPV